jgi:hypothetical protein
MLVPMGSVAVQVVPLLEVSAFVAVEAPLAYDADTASVAVSPLVVQVSVSASVVLRVSRTIGFGVTEQEVMLTPGRSVVTAVGIALVPGTVAANVRVEVPEATTLVMLAAGTVAVHELGPPVRLTWWLPPSSVHVTGIDPVELFSPTVVRVSVTGEPGTPAEVTVAVEGVAVKLLTLTPEAAWPLPPTRPASEPEPLGAYVLDESSATDVYVDTDRVALPSVQLTVIRTRVSRSAAEADRGVQLSGPSFTEQRAISSVSW